MWNSEEEKSFVLGRYVLKTTLVTVITIPLLMTIGYFAHDAEWFGYLFNAIWIGFLIAYVRYIYLRWLK